MYFRELPKYPAAELLAVGHRRRALQIGVGFSRAVAGVLLVVLLWVPPALADTWERGRAELRIGNEEAAARLFRRAARNGDVRARYDLGILHLKGAGVPQDDEAGAKWLRRAAKGGLPAAQSLLGSLYSKGRGVERDDAEAVVWFERAASVGDANGQVGLGIMLASGRGIARNNARAVQWLLLASAQGNELAEERLREVRRQVSRKQYRQGEDLAEAWKPRKRGGYHPGNLRYNDGTSR